MSRKTRGQLSKKKVNKISKAQCEDKDTPDGQQQNVLNHMQTIILHRVQLESITKLFIFSSPDDIQILDFAIHIPELGSVR